MEESPCHKIVFDFSSPTKEELLQRKRACSELNDNASECSKRIRKQLQDFDLSSGTSSMDTDDDDDCGDSFNSSKNSSVSDVAQKAQDGPGPSTSTAVQDDAPSSPKVNIISVDIIPTDEVEEVADDNGNDVQIVAVEEVPCSSTMEEAAAQKALNVEKKKQPETNRIVISDSSSDEEDTTNNNNNRRHSDGPFASAYSFTNVNGDQFEARSSFSRGRHHHHQSHRFRRSSHNQSHANQRARQFEEQARDFQRSHEENMERVQEHVRMAREHASRARDQAFRAVRASTSAIPDLVSTFQAHFRRPMFRVADINQQIFGNFYRH